MRAASAKTSRTWLILLLVAVFGFIPAFRQEPTVPAAKGPLDKSTDKSIPPISKRGPGMKGPATDLKLPVPRTFDLSHVQPEHFAMALGKDPQRIFEFVRDHIAYEVYSGCLRGPHGALLAMAGNSVDRAALLASLLEKSGHKVRFARGTLPEALAQELVTSMWAERPRPGRQKEVGESSPALKQGDKTLLGGVHRDFEMIREQLKKMAKFPTREPAVGLEALVKEAEAHYWVQWSRDGKWLDLDPAFADTASGAALTKAQETFASLPEALYHRVTVRLRLEEYAILLQGNAAPTISTRETLQYTAKAAELSGVDLVLTHQPENWKGPAKSLKSAVETALKDTGRIRPVLIAGPDKWIAGQPFRQKPPTGKGIGGIADLLGGEGTRKPVPIATAQSLEFEFISPGGGKETVTREIFDLIGPARRAEAKKFTSQDVRDQSTGVGAVDVTEAIYDLLFTTGRVAAAHAANIVKDAAATADEPPEIAALLRRLNLAVALTSDAVLPRLCWPGRAVVLFYPESPRLSIAELSGLSGTARIALDLRRDQARALALGPQPVNVFEARIFRGVVDGTLERVLIERLTAPLRAQGKWGPLMSTSSLFEQAQAEGVSSLALPADEKRLDRNIAGNARARLKKETAGGFVVVVPQRALSLGAVQRLAWWRINPRSGETIAVGDDGLHPVATEYKISENTTDGNVRISVRYVSGDPSNPAKVTVQTYRIAMENFSRVIDALLEHGATLAGGGLGSLP
jgi:large repetitive protein